MKNEFELLLDQIDQRFDDEMLSRESWHVLAIVRIMIKERINAQNEESQK